MFVWLELNVTHSVWRYATFWDYNRMSGYINKGDRFIFLSHDLRLSILALLRARVGNFCAHFAIKCSSFCQINVGTSKRSACDSLGFAFYPSVLSSNKLLERTGHVGYTAVFSICFLYLCYHHFSVYFHLSCSPTSWFGLRTAMPGRSAWFCWRQRWVVCGRWNNQTDHF